MLLTDLSVATMSGDAPYGLIADAAIAVDGGAIVWVGPADKVPAEHRALEQIALGGRLVTPGLIDCHTHLVFGGDRAGEFEMRLNGASYEEVARAGGGIVSTVRDTRAASEDDLVASALPRLDALLAEGVTTVEIKSGYGLDRETEARMLRAARRLGEARAVDVVTTYLGAHALPPEYAGQADAYLADV
ncbi:MAG: imidazolonepropionase, partial [Pseudomonadota bacterium]